jgi:hypothetical protein
MGKEAGRIQFDRIKWGNVEMLELLTKVPTAYLLDCSEGVALRVLCLDTTTGDMSKFHTTFYGNHVLPISTSSMGAGREALEC